MSYINEYNTMLVDADEYIAQGKDFPRIKLELYEMYFLAAIADELHALNITQKDIRNELNLKPAQPERNRGFWRAIEKGEKGYSAGNFRCSMCGEPNVSYISKPNFCPNCGADMRGELE